MDSLGKMKQNAIDLPFHVFQYSSHLEFLQDAYDYFHERDESISYDQIALACGLKSRTHARNLVKGIQKATELQLFQICEFFGVHDEEEKKYLVYLQEFQNCSDVPTAQSIFQRLVELQRRKQPLANPFKEIEVATSVLHMTLLSAFELESVEQTPTALSVLFKGRYTEEEIIAAVGDLLRCGFIQKDALTGRLKLLQKHIRKYDYNANLFLQKFHEQCLDLARDALLREPTSDRYLIGASFSINHKVFPRLIQKINAFVENLMRLEGVAGESDTIVQLNTQLIKMTKSERGLGQVTTEREFADTKNSVIA